MPEKALKATLLNMPFCNRKGINLCIKAFIDCKMASALIIVAFLKILKASMPPICMAFVFKLPVFLSLPLQDYEIVLNISSYILLLAPLYLLVPYSLSPIHRDESRIFLYE